MKAINFYLKRGQVVKDNSYKNLSKNFLEKARYNLITMSVLSDLNKNKKIRSALNLSEDYDSNEWVVICGYYAMYSAALALIAKAGFRSKNHTATLIVLDEFFVKKNLLDNSSLSLLKHAIFKREEVEKLTEARNKREIAQYGITKETTRTIAENIKKDAYDFVNKCEEILGVMNN
jgi:uncharacterized protein (UPF0332 family)